MPSLLGGLASPSRSQPAVSKPRGRPRRRVLAAAAVLLLACAVLRGRSSAGLLTRAARSLLASSGEDAAAAAVALAAAAAAAGQREFARELLTRGPPGPAQCRVLSFRTAPDPPACMDEYSHPFSGCFSPSYEADTFQRLRAGRPVTELRCGFLSPAGRRWLAGFTPRFAHCRYVVATVSFSYGSPKSTSHVRGGQEGVCFVAFVDARIHAGLQEAHPSAWNGTHLGRWAVELLDPALLSDTIARSSHLLKLMVPRLFPGASYSLYLDRKVRLPEDPLGLLRQVEALAPSPHVVATFEHPLRGDVFTEILADFHHLGWRRVFVPNDTDPEVAESYRRGIRGRDFHDLFRLYIYYSQAGFPLHYTGMLDSMLLIWNHGHACAAAFACMWANQVAYLSMREQLSFNYVASMLALTQQVFYVTPFAYDFSAPVSVRLARLPAVGEYVRDSQW